MWIWVDTKYACGGIEVTNGKVVATPPIWKKWLGIHISKFLIIVKADKIEVVK